MEATAKRPCIECGQPTAGKEYCLTCKLRLGFTFQISTSAEGEDAPLRERVESGTASFNLGLPGVHSVVGTHPDGKPKYDYRPISNNELPTRRKREDYAKRHGLEAVGGTAKRAIGGRA